MSNLQQRVLVSNVKAFLGRPIIQVLSERLSNCHIFAHDKSFDNTKSRDEFFSSLTLGTTAKVELIPGDSVQDIIAKVNNRIDVLINNDGYPAVRNPINKVERKELIQTLNELTVFPFELTSQLLPYMQERRQGKIIFITSATPFRGLPNYSPYAVARGATNAMALTFAQELARYNIQVNAVAPNFIESPTYFPQHLLDNPETYEKIVRPIPLKRLGKPEEPAELVAFLASERADYITGQIMPFAGGWA